MGGGGLEGDVTLLRAVSPWSGLLGGIYEYAEILINVKLEVRDQ